MTFKQLLINETDETLITKAIKEVKWNNKSKWMFKGSVEFYPFDGEYKWNGIYNTSDLTQIPMYNVKIDGKNYILKLQINEGVTITIFEEINNELKTIAQNYYSIPEWNKFVKPLRTGLLINAFNKKAYAKIDKIIRGNLSYREMIYATIIFDNGSKLNLISVNHQHPLQSIVSGITNAIDGILAPFKEAKEKLEKVFSYEMSQMDVIKEFKKIKPLSDESNSSSIPSSHYVNGIKITTVQKYDIKSLIKKYSEDNVKKALSMLFTNIPTIEKGIASIVSSNSKWYD